MYYVFRLSYSTPIMVDDDADVTNKTDEFEKVNKYTKITIYCWLIFILIISNFRIFHIVPIIQLLNHNLQLSQHHHQLQQESLISHLTHFLGYPDSTFLEGLGLGLGKRSKGSIWVSTRHPGTGFQALPTGSCPYPYSRLIYQKMKSMSTKILTNIWLFFNVL